MATEEEEEEEEWLDEDEDDDEAGDDDDDDDDDSMKQLWNLTRLTLCIWLACMLKTCLIMWLRLGKLLGQISHLIQQAAAILALFFVCCCFCIRPIRGRSGE